VVFLNDKMLRGFVDEQLAINHMNDLKSMIPKDQFGCDVGLYCYHIKEVDVIM
jgi:hypothetical protein